MAVSGKIVRNPKTNQEIRFLRTSKDTGGKLLEMETTYRGVSKEPVAHYHPFQVEDFKVMSGELSVRLRGKDVQVLREGDSLRVGKNEVHSMWNDSNATTIVHWMVQPALNTEYFLETAMGLANEGNTNEDGMPGLLQIAMMVSFFSDVFRLANPPFLVQKVLFAVIAPFGYLAGYRPTYKKYID